VLLAFESGRVIITFIAFIGNVVGEIAIMTSSTTTEYRHIARVPEIWGGRPIIRGTRTPIKTIVGYYKLGLSVEEILEGLPHLTPAQVYEALSYYHDHLAEIEQDIQESQVDHLLEGYGLSTNSDGRIIVDPE
jgi:uncharacterized protein (DUF433 family)